MFTVSELERLVQWVSSELAIVRENRKMTWIEYGGAILGACFFPRFGFKSTHTKSLIIQL